MIDLYVNLPSKNRFRRPTTYVSSGYKSRRMAIDRNVPLVTNVKCAKLLLEAIVRKPSLEINSVDFKTSHQTFSFPGLISVQTFVPGVAKAGSNDLAVVSEAASRAGFTSLQILPQGVGAQVDSAAALAVAQRNAAGKASCDYFFGVAASASNADSLGNDAIASGARSLFVPSSFASSVNKVAAVSAHFAAWPADKPIVTDAKTTDLASILLLTSLHGRNVHVTNVKTRDDIQLIALSKERGLQVTCDVAVYSLFFTKEQFAGATCLPTADDQKALWANLAVIDTFSIGTIPYQLALDLNQEVSPCTGIEETLPLLLGAVSDGRLTLEDITLRLHDNPRAIFDLPEQPSTLVDVDTNRTTSFSAPKGCWSPLTGNKVSGVVHRVVIDGKAVFIDGVSSPSPSGQDLSSAAPSRARKLARRPSRPVVSSPMQPSASGPAALRSPTLKSAEPFQPLSFTSGASAGSSSREAHRPFANLQPHASFHRKHVLSVKQYTREDLHAIFSLASEMRNQVERYGSVDTLRGRVISTMFFEPSTRTSTSFEAAMKRCGGDVTVVNADTSSVTKGESLADTVRTLGCYTDAIVLRHPAVGSAKTAAKYSPVPIINAGDGIGEHPTQSLLDVFTMREELGSVNGMTITMSASPLSFRSLPPDPRLILLPPPLPAVGDLKNGRTVHSLVRVLSLYNVTLNFVSPPALAMPEAVTQAARKAGITVKECVNLDEVIASSDVLYVTRVQKERFSSEAEYESVKVRRSSLSSPASPPPLDLTSPLASPPRRTCSSSTTRCSRAPSRRPSSCTRSPASTRSTPRSTLTAGRPTSGRCASASLSAWPSSPWSSAKPLAVPTFPLPLSLSFARSLACSIPHKRLPPHCTLSTTLNHTPPKNKEARSLSL
jgi:carbamoyl-phosphate synthase/aspartate carbamoyltransferase